MSVCGEIENLEYEIKQHEIHIEELRKRLDKLLMSRSGKGFDEHKNSDRNNSSVSPKDIWDGDGGELFI